MVNRIRLTVNRGIPCGLRVHQAWLASCLLLVTACLGSSRADDPQAGDAGKQPRFTNELIHSTSPYLLQHAHNPVNWMPWGPEAFAKAKREHKPIFVSIGYSTCYWCHVMERESFEDEEVAQVINEHYIAIKVDREQRPDIDEQLMIATQLLNGRGGWPNSVWLTPDGRPWMAGTYFPKLKFVVVLEKLSEVWEKQPKEVEQQADSFAEAIRNVSNAESGGASAVISSQLPIERAMAEAQQLFDTKFGGFGSKPKFPPHGMLRLLAFEAREHADASALAMLTRTLDAIYSGGIHDHVGGGFHRYSTDERWFLPHFEKMLYDNAQLMRSFTEAYEITHDALYREAVEDIASWLSREMTDSRGGFYSAIDSESDGEEGRYYTWSIAELKSSLKDVEAERFAAIYNFDVSGNFVEEASGERPGTNIPFLDLDARQLRELIADEPLIAIRTELQQTRRKREHPRVDDKVLASWNGLMISSLARAGRVLEEPRYTAAAEKAATFVLQDLVDGDRLMRTWRAGVAELPGYLEDYAFVADGLLELHVTTQNSHWLDEARRLVDQMIEQFEDQKAGGFFFTGPEHEELIVRSKGLGGGGNLPVANGVAAVVLLELFKQTGEMKYKQSLDQTLSGLTGILHKSPREVELLVLADAQLRLLESAQKLSFESQPDAVFRSEAVKAELFVSHKQVVVGQTINLAVVLNIDKGFHLYADETDNSELIRSARVRVMPIDGVELGAVESPAGMRKFDPVLGQEIGKLVGRAVFLQPLTLTQSVVPAKISLHVEVDYQACDTSLCLRPVTKVMEFELTVADMPGEKRHASVFP